MFDPELQLQYSPSQWSGEDPEKLLEKYIKDEGKILNEVQAKYNLEEVKYGEEQSQSVDVWGNVGEEMYVFIHGGYWLQGNRKYALSTGYQYLIAGWAVASIGYKYAAKPYGLTNTTLDIIKALEVILQRYPQLKRVTVAGHSAGGHLAWKAASRVNSPKIKSVILFTPVLKLEQIVHINEGIEMGLTDTEAKELSCYVEEFEKLDVRTLILTAALDAPAFNDQAASMAAEMKNAYPHKHTEHHIFKNANHFTILSEMADSDSEQRKVVQQFEEGIQKK